MNMFVGNLILYYLLSHAIDEGVHNYPAYIYFVNCSLNVIPNISSLTSKREVGIVLQKQYENLELNSRYLQVVLYFDGKSYNIKIDINTIYSLEVVGKGKIDLEYRLTNSYMAKITKMSGEEFAKNMQKASSIISKNDTYIIRMNNKTRNEKKNTIINIEDIIRFQNDIDKK